MKYILVNFKTNKNWLEITDYFNKLEDFYKKNSINSEKNIFFLTSLHILLAIQKFPIINFGNQSGSHLGLGAYTSTVSIEQLFEDGVKNILLGHSEENKYFGLTEEVINLKLKKALSFNLNIFLCFGNQTQENNFDVLSENLVNTLDKIFDNINLSQYNKKIVLCYEPIFVIGTGKALLLTEAEEIISKIKSKLLDKYNICFDIVYGGSVNLNNASYFLNSKFIDGVLIGNAGLNVSDIKQIIELNKNIKYD